MRADPEPVRHLSDRLALCCDLRDRAPLNLRLIMATLPQSVKKAFTRHGGSDDLAVQIGQATWPALARPVFRSRRPPRLAALTLMIVSGFARQQFVVEVGVTAALKRRP